MKKLMLAAALTLGAAAYLPAPAGAQTGFDIVVSTAPPPVRAERVPAPRRGYVWVPGYWNWRNNAFAWQPGHWERARAGEVFRRPEWVQERDGWRLVGGWQPAYAREAPPPPRVERMPGERRGYAWVPGHWDWRGGEYVWVEGHWMRGRSGWYFREPRWVERDGRWFLEEGRWVRGRRDRDGDGIPNRYDRDRDGDGIPNRYDRDRDGDGIPNRYERGDSRRDANGVPDRTEPPRDRDGVPNRYDPATGAPAPGDPRR